LRLAKGATPVEQQHLGITAAEPAGTESPDIAAIARPSVLLEGTWNRIFDPYPRWRSGLIRPDEDWLVHGRIGLPDDSQRPG
jgi:hypothetical protein